MQPRTYSARDLTRSTLAILFVVALIFFSGWIALLPSSIAAQLDATFAPSPDTQPMPVTTTFFT